MIKLTSGQKVAVSLLVSVVLFSIFTVIAFSGLFDFVETKFYQPMITQNIETRLGKVVDSQNKYIDSLFKRFETFASDLSVRSYVESRPNNDSVQSREKLRSSLMMDTRALRGIRIIDANGINIHYSSFSSDVMKSSSEQITYKKYSDLVNSKTSPEISYVKIKVSDTRSSSFGNLKQNLIYKDEIENRLILSLPFYDSSENYAGTIAFYCDPSDLSRFLFEENLIDITGFGFLITDEDGFGGYAFGLSNVGRISLENLILEQWQIDSKNKINDVSVRNIIPQIQDSDNNSNSEVKILFTKNSIREDLGFVSWIYDKDVMIFPQMMKILLLVLVFITLFLIVYLIFNLFKDDMVVIRDRIKRFQLAFVTETIDRKSNIPVNIADRREKINDEIKKSLGRRGSRYSKEIDELLNQSWNDIFRLLGIKDESESVNSAELKRVLEEVLGNGSVKINAVYSNSIQPEIKDSVPSTPQQNESEVEVIDDIPLPEEKSENVIEDSAKKPEVESVEDVEEVSEAESVEEVESVEEIEEVSEAESVEEVESVEDIDEVSEAESVEDVESVEEIEEVSEAESVEDVESVEEIEEVSEAEDFEEVESVEDVEEVSEAEDVEEVESVEDIEEVSEAESVEEVESVEEIEEVSEAEDVEEVESVEEIEEVSEAESVEEVEEFEPAESDTDYIDVTKEFDVDEEEKLDELEDVDLDFFEVGDTSYNLNDDSTFDEKLEFSSPERKINFDASGDKLAVNFDVASPDYTFLDDEKNIEEVQELGKKENAELFSFTKFSADSFDKLEEL